jgi:hypothetical protein
MLSVIYFYKGKAAAAGLAEGVYETV